MNPPGPLTCLCDVANIFFSKQGLPVFRLLNNYAQLLATRSFIPNTLERDYYGSDSFTRGEN